MRQYDSYKDSGVQWIGDIPSHWELCRLKNHTAIVLGKMIMSNPPKGEEDKYSLEKYLKSRNIGWLYVIDSEEEVEEMWFNDYEKSLYRLRLNDIVMNEGGDVGKIGIWRNTNYDCYIQNSVNKITCDNSINPFYLQYLLFAISKTNYFWSIVNPVSIAHLTKEKLSITPIICPPLFEQQAIATYLDKKCGEIDKAIETQTKRIELLKELRQNIITHAVTRGLNPDAPLKDSGVEWIGQVPEHWEIRKLKQAVNSITDVDHTMPNNVTKGIPYIMTGDLKEKISKIDLDNCKQISLDDFVNLSNKSKASKGDIIFARYATIGTVCYVDEESDFIVSYSCVTIKRNPKLLNGLFLFYYLKSFVFLEDITQNINSNTQGNVGIESLCSSIIILPPLLEQQEIVAYIDKNNSRLDNSIAKAERQISLLQELKQSIITEVVTGKRKVC